MTKDQKRPSYCLRLRSYPEGKFVSLWLLQAHPGGALECRMFGEVLPAVAEELIKALGLSVEREECPLEGMKPMVGQQKELFS